MSLVSMYFAYQSGVGLAILLLFIFIATYVFYQTYKETAVYVTIAAIICLLPYIVYKIKVAEAD